MSNSYDIVAAWVETLASRPEIPFASKLKEQFEASAITRLCGCGCHSFDCSIQDTVQLQPLCPPGQAGLPLEIAFSSNCHEPIDVFFFTDKNGFLAGIEIQYGLSNSEPMPEKICLGEVIYTIP